MPSHSPILCVYNLFCLRSVVYSSLFLHQLTCTLPVHTFFFLRLFPIDSRVLHIFRTSTDMRVVTHREGLDLYFRQARSSTLPPGGKRSSAPRPRPTLVRRNGSVILKGWRPATKSSQPVSSVCDTSTWSDCDSDATTVVNDSEEEDLPSPLPKDEDKIMCWDATKPNLPANTIAIEVPAKERARAPSPEDRMPPPSPEDDFIPLIEDDDDFPEILQVNNHHGHSTLRLKFLRDIWEVRQSEWLEWERDNSIAHNENQTAYDGIFRSPPPKPFHPWQPSPSQVNLTSGSPLQTPTSPVIVSNDATTAPIYPRAGNLKEIHDLRSVMLDRALGDVPLHSISKALFLWNLTRSGENSTLVGDISNRSFSSASDYSETSLYASTSSVGSSNSNTKPSDWNHVLFHGLDPTSLARYRTLFSVLNKNDYALKATEQLLSELSLNGIDWRTECARAEATTTQQERARVAEMGRPRSPAFFLDDDDDDEEDEEDDDMSPFDDGGRDRYEYGDMRMIEHPGDVSMGVDRYQSQWGEYVDMVF